MDAATIAVLVATGLAIGFIVWLRFYAPQSEAGKDATRSDSKAEQASEIEAPTSKRRRKSR